MSAAESFRRRFGAPDPSAPPGLRFPGRGDQTVWEDLQRQIGAGWFLDGFVYLFGEGLDALSPCLAAWDFLLPPGPQRVVIGRNAYGALLVAENPDEEGFTCPVGLLDPLHVRYWRHPEVVLMNLVGHWLPDDQVPGFLDSRMYDAWHGTTGDRLELTEALAIKTPLSLGGEITAGNFQIEKLVDYYRSTAEIYRDVPTKKKGGGGA